MKSECIDLYYKLHEWSRKEMRVEVMGYEDSGGLGWSRVMGSCLTDLDFICSEPDYYLRKWEELSLELGVGVSVYAGIVSGGYKLEVNFGDSWFSFIGDRLEVLLSVHLGICELYMALRRPTVVDLGDFIRGVYTRGGTCSGDFRADRNGRMSLCFSGYSYGADFFAKYPRFVSYRSPMVLGHYGVEHYHGNLEMMEGSVCVYSCYGVTEPPAMSVSDYGGLLVTGIQAGSISTGSIITTGHGLSWGTGTDIYSTILTSHSRLPCSIKIQKLSERVGGE